MLAAAVTVEAVMIVVCLLGLMALRYRIAARRRAVEDGVRLLEPVLHTWLVLDRDLGAVVDTLRGMSAYAAFRSLARLSTQHVTFERQQTLARVLRTEPWVAAMLRCSGSRFWWRRFDAARLLSIVGVEADAACVAQLLTDRNPAVRLVAIDAAARLNGRPLVEQELDDLPRHQDAVQAYQLAALARHAPIVAQALEPRLRPDTPVAALNAWIDAAGALAIPGTLSTVRTLATHPLPQVRLHVARALRRYADPETPGVLLTLLADSDWRVRAQAARALGALRCGVATGELAEAVRDPAWWVRYRSALALAQIGGPARDALTALTQGDDRMARDMSELVAGLSTAAVIEMSEV